MLNSTDNTKLKKILELLFIPLLLFAYLSHLGFTPIDTETDEARRALVSAEMMLSNNFISPTLNGALYLNKPPLYNWIIIGWFKLFGGYSMFAFRLPVIIATIGMALTVFYFLKKHTTMAIAFAAAWAYATNGRILIYDSLQGLIDTTFSWVVFTGFMLVYYYGEKKKYYHLFITTYLLAAIGYLMKGLPAVAFQGITLLTYFVWKKNFKKLFSLSHIWGVITFITMVAAYYLLYFSSNDISPASVFENIFNESSKRTIVEFGFADTLQQLLTFPFQMMYHFAPWTIFIIAMMQKNISSRIKKNNFIHYCALIFITNIFLYWTSPQVYARYLFMFLPLLFAILFYLFNEAAEKKLWQQKFMRWFVVAVTGILFLAAAASPFIDAAASAQNFYYRYAVLVLLFAGILIIAVKYKSLYLHVFIAAILITRIAFNWFVVEQRGKRYFDAASIAERISSVTKDSNLFILGDAHVGNFDGMSFHISTRRNEVLTFDSVVHKNTFYIADCEQLQNKQYTSYLSFTNFLADSLELVTFTSEDTIHARR